MKTSLILDDTLVAEAKRTAEASQQSLSAVINRWAQIGRQSEPARATKLRRPIRTVDLGPPKLNLNRRSDWVTALEADEKLP